MKNGKKEKLDRNKKNGGRKQQNKMNFGIFSFKIFYFLFNREFF